MSIQALRERLTIGPVALRDKEHTSVALTEIKAALAEVDALEAQLAEANERAEVAHQNAVYLGGRLLETDAAEENREGEYE